MRNWTRTGAFWFLLTSALALLLVLSIGTLTPAVAAVTLTRESQGQMLYQSQQTLRDQQGYSWEVVVSKHTGFASPPTISLQLAGPTDRVSVDHEQPLTLIPSHGNTLEAVSVPESLYIDRPLAPNINQYDLKPIVSELNGPLELSIAAEWPSAISTEDEKTVKLTIPALVIQEWQTVATCADILCTGS
ncbi:hypothetical protein C1752_08696 [Acaryochloris thomasi RCC1774]|uniref:DUF3122 domain-containing protein n=1 Tax=Acaryochloris thomasi RCC1774 TaxID=1764569 RepID=A0A2W1JNU4_9CYAN|nr:DUF3122 domain-containing protein [Acaryochloris thomasi]PZD70921.1 hypothetical protein C1752_08696 [Acaryochloris thomasi RCC1774]